MKLVRLRIKNYRSIVDSGDIRIEPLLAFVGENNCGKSNLLRAVNVFLAAGAGGMSESDFNAPAEQAVIEGEFGSLADLERKKLRSYLIGDRLILQKQLSVFTDEKTGKKKVSAEYHGYRALPHDWWLSVEKIVNEKGARPKWEEIAAEHGLLDFVRDLNGKISKPSYESGLAKYLLEHDEVEYDEPVLGDTQALGLQPNLLSVLPRFYLLPAITDYSDEIDRRSSSTVFRRLMADLSDRIMRADARYAELEAAIEKIRQLLNPQADDQQVQRLASLTDVEDTLKSTAQKLMPGVQNVRLLVEVEAAQDLFSQGVAIQVDDGVLTGVLDKGHGMQRCIVFSLLQMLMKLDSEAHDHRPIILAIEEPELYIHPHTQRLVYGVLKKFSAVEEPGGATESDQVLYSTHAPAMIDISRYNEVAVVRKAPANGTKVFQCSKDALGSVEERSGFKLLTCFGLEHNEIFFSRACIIVEGVEDEIAIIATARKCTKIVDLPDEVGVSIVVADGKREIPKFQKILNAFAFPYGVLLELDGQPETAPSSAAIISNLAGNRVAQIPNRLEGLVGLDHHFKDRLEAKTFFCNAANINEDLEKVVLDLWP